MALGIVIDKDIKHVQAAEKMGKDAQPVVPLILSLTNSLAPMASREPPMEATGHQAHLKAQHEFRTCASALVVISPDDPDINKAIIGMLSNPQAANREHALSLVTKLKNKKLALAPGESERSDEEPNPSREHELRPRGRKYHPNNYQGTRIAPVRERRGPSGSH